jgi:hypothetical protein
VRSGIFGSVVSASGLSHRLLQRDHKGATREEKRAGVSRLQGGGHSEGGMALEEELQREAAVLERLRF